MQSNHRIRATRLLALLGTAAALVAFAWPAPDSKSSAITSIQLIDTRAQVPYVPTREDVMNEMLRMAAVTKDDVVYDLGCGDGRIVITAAKQFGAKGVGIDIDPERIKESNANANQAGVTDRVQFIVGDLFDADVSKATVVALYLLPSVNLRLRPKLERELRPGTRVVSHNYDMGDWTPLKRTQIGDHIVYLWVIPDKPRSSN